MIDIHSHFLPFLDDGAPDMETAIKMARLAYDDGIRLTGCTPHLTPGVYDTSPQTIANGLDGFRKALNHAGIPLKIFAGADVHIAPNLSTVLSENTIYRLNGTRYFLFEPPHHIVPPRIVELTSELLDVGFIPIVTHPERLTWINKRYDLIEKLNDMGCLIQVTAGSLEGRFGETAQHWATRLLIEGRMDVIATDAHNLNSRKPNLSKARAIVEAALGMEEGYQVTTGRPMQILKNESIEPRFATLGRPEINTNWSIANTHKNDGGTKEKSKAMSYLSRILGR